MGCISSKIIEKLQEYLINEEPVPEALHEKMHQLLLQYTVVDGMPEVVNTFVQTKQMNNVLALHRDIVRSYEDDMVKYADDRDKSLIKECFQNLVKKIRNSNMRL